MSQNVNAVASSARAPLAWYTIWLRALTRPSVAAFQDLSDTHATVGRALVWMLVSAGVGYGLAAIGQLALRLFAVVVGGAPLSAIGLGSFSIVMSVGGAILSVFLSVLCFIVGTGITHLAARGLGGVGSFSKLAFAFAAYSAPLALVASALGFFGVLGMCLVVPLGIYGFVLSIIAVKAVNQIGWGSAVAVSVARLVVVTLILLVGGLLIVGGLAVWASSVMFGPSALPLD